MEDCSLEPSTCLEELEEVKEDEEVEEDALGHILGNLTEHPGYIWTGSKMMLLSISCLQISSISVCFFPALGLVFYLLVFLLR